MSIISLTCSPRPNGNTDTIGKAISDQLNQSLHPTEIIPLRSVTIQPCTACGFCAQHTEQCILEAQDEGGWLFDKVWSAQALIIIAPIFFYGPPAQLKSFIDRAQKYWHASGYTFNNSASKKTLFKPAFTVLIAAKNTGERIFEPSLLILQCFLQSIGFFLQDELLLRGLDGPQDFLQSKHASSDLHTFIQEIQNAL